MALVYKVILAKQAQKDLEDLDRNGYGDKARELLDILIMDPFQYPPKYKKLWGEVEGTFSRRINAEHRLVCDVLPLRVMSSKALSEYTGCTLNIKG